MNYCNNKNSDNTKNKNTKKQEEDEPQEEPQQQQEEQPEEDVKEEKISIVEEENAKEKEGKIEIVELKQQPKEAKSEKLPFTFLPYIPKKDNDIDHAVAKALNENLLDIDVKQVQIKNKKRRRDTKHKGEYMIHGDRVHVRMLQGVLVVRVQNEWVNFVRFVQERLGFEDE